MGNIVLDNIEIRDFPELSTYQFDAPNGQWCGRLDCLAWGRSNNLFLYITDQATGQKYRLSTFSRTRYRPSTGGPSFKDEKVGTRYQLTTSLSRNGHPKLTSAIPVETDVSEVDVLAAFRHAASP